MKNYSEKTDTKHNIRLALRYILISSAAAAAVSAAAFYAVRNASEPSSRAEGSAIPEKVIIAADVTQSGQPKQTSGILTLTESGSVLTVPEIVKKAKPSVVGISSEFSGGIISTGTGIILSQDGYIVTNAHVVQNTENGITERPEKVTAVLSDSSSCSAEIIGADAQTDLAVIKIAVSPSELIPAEFGNSSLLKEGETAVAIGNPLGFELYGSTTCGIISALNRRITVGGYEMTLIQTDAAINPGNSGGPLLNSSGQVVGINSSKIISDHAEGLGFAIPISSARPVIDSLIANGYVTGRPIIAISGESVSELTAEHYGLPCGICVRFITPDSHAQSSGLETGDIIICFNGSRVLTTEQLDEALEGYSAGDSVTLTVYRPDDDLQCEIPLILDEKN
ncbi:MAG: trypsin-like peptidase domain-containing protein [Oscillospiraceae bacterium]|nr:trypsin-like peptidase domain-containing protein [Oscillospiraceae bacterium]